MLKSKVITQDRFQLKHLGREKNATDYEFFQRGMPPANKIDRSDEEFEAFLLEVLSDFQITIPEIGTLSAKARPLVIVTSSRTREIHDALKRRCLYHWIDCPSFEKEYRIVTTKVPNIEETLAEQICQFMQTVTEKDFYKKPAIAETLDWVRALIHLDKSSLNQAAAEETLGCIFKP